MWKLCNKVSEINGIVPKGNGDMKKLAGKRYFEALGRSEASRNVPRSMKHYEWDKWAQKAYMRGRLVQKYAV